MIFPSTLIISKNEVTSLVKLEELVTILNHNLSENNPDIFRINQTTGWGIDAIRQIKGFLSQKPINHDTKIVIIYQAHNLGTESQNALLKSLEEPPEDSHLILLTPNRQSLLDTILSRCHCINLIDDRVTQSQEFLAPQPTLAANLQLSDTLSQDKTSVLPYLENQLALYQQQMITNPTLAPTVKKLFRTLLMVRANVDPKNAIDWFLLS